MATRTTYIIGSGSNYLDFDLNFANVTLRGQSAAVIGSSAVDYVFVRPGTDIDFTSSGASVDRLYLTGNLSDYAITASGNTLTLTRNLGTPALSETVLLAVPVSAAASDTVVFANGSASSFALRQSIGSGSAATLSGETSLAPVLPSILNASVTAQAVDPAVFASLRPGMSLTAIGSAGVDVVYVKPGGAVNATSLNGGSDLVYFTGAWADYTKTTAGTRITFARTINGHQESVIVAGSTGGLNDTLVFADGAVRSNPARQALVSNPLVSLANIPGRDLTQVSPGVFVTVPATITALGSDSGQSSSDFVTNVALQTVLGTYLGVLTSDEKIQVSVDAGVSWIDAPSIVTSALGGTFAAAGVTLQAGAGQALSVRTINTLNNTLAGVGRSYVLDVTAPAAPSLALASDTGASASDGITNTGLVAVTGLELNARWDYSVDGGATWLTGSASSFTLAPGVYAAGVVQVRQSDVAGNLSAVSAAGAINVDTTAPFAPIILLVTDTGFSASDGITSAGALNVVGVEQGASWEYSIDGIAWLPGTGTSFTLAQGAYGIDAVKVRQTDLAGNRSLTANGNPSAITVDTTAPLAPSLVLATDAGASAVDGITNNGTVLVFGRESGAAWEYSLDGSTWLAGSGGSLTLEPGTYAIGSISLRQVDAAGNVSTSGVNAGVITVDTTAPAEPTLALAADTGSSASDGITQSGLMTVAGLEAGASWQYSLNSGLLGSWVDGTGSGFTLPEGTYAAGTVQVRQSDVAGNISLRRATGSAITVDLTAPPVPVITLASDSGASATDGITSVGLMNVAGLVAGASWQSSIDGGATWVAGTGSSFTLAEAVHAPASVRVRQFDLAGNASTGIYLGAITVDTTSPVVTMNVVAGNDIISAAEVGSILTGSTEAGSSVSLTLGTGNVRAATVVGTSWSYGLLSADIAALGQGVHVLGFSATDLAGNVGSGTRSITIATVAPSLSINPVAADNIVNVSESTAPTVISGTNASGASVTLTLGGVARAATVSGTTWSYTLLAADISNMGLGGETLIATTGADANGNIGRATRDIVVDTALPTLATVTDTAATIVSQASGNILFNYVFSENIATLSASSFTVGNGIVSSVTGNGSNWQVAVTPNLGVASGNLTLALKPGVVIDIAGNVGTVTSTVTRAMDTQSPALSLAIGAAGTVANAASAIAAGGVVNVTAESAATVQVTMAGTSGSVTKTVTGNGATVVPVVLLAADITALGQGAVRVTARALDAAGNPSTGSGGNFSLDTIAPSVTVTDSLSGVVNQNTAGVVYTYTFSKVVTGLAVNDFTVANGSVSNVSGSGTTWQVTVVPNNQTNGATALLNSGFLGVTLNANAVQDSAGNGNASDFNNAQALDMVAPALDMANTAQTVFSLATATAATGVDTVTAELDAAVSVTLAGTRGSVTKTFTGTGAAQPVVLTSGDITVLGQGVVNVTATALDAAGNATSAGQGGIGFSGLYSGNTTGTTTVNKTFALDTTKNQAVLDVDMIKGDSWDANEAFTIYVNDIRLLTFVPEVAVPGGLDGVAASGALTGTSGVSWVITSSGVDSQIVGVTTYTDRVYHLQLIVDNPTASTLKFGVGAILDSGTVADESFALDNVLVVSRNAAAPVTSAVVVGNDKFEPGTTATGWSFNDAGTYLAGYQDHSFRLDTVAPAVTISPIAGDDVINFSERTSVISGTAEAGSSVSLRIGNTTRFPNTSGTSWNYTLSSFDINNLGQGANKVITATATDGAGNQGVITRTVVVDTVAPTFGVASSVTPTINLASGNVVFTYNFNEAVTGLNAGSFTVANGVSPPLVSGSGAVWKVTVTPTSGVASGTLDLTLLDNSVLDAAGNRNSGATTQQAIDTLAPTVSLAVGAAGAVANGVTSVAAGGVVNVTAENGSSVVVTLTGTNSAITKSLTGNGLAQAVVLLPAEVTALGEGAVLVTARATDPAGNPSTAAGGNFTLTTLPPSVVVTDNVPGIFNANMSTITYTYTFNKPVSAPSAGSFALVNASAPVISGSGTTWQVTVSPDLNRTGTGTPVTTPAFVSITLNAGAVLDSAGNGNLVDVNAAQVIDNVAPLVALAGTGSTLFNLATATAATGVASVTAENGTSVNVTLTGQSGNVTKTFTGTGAAQAVTLTAGDVTLLGQGGVTVVTSATDSAGNVGTAGQGGNFYLGSALTSNTNTGAQLLSKTFALSTAGGLNQAVIDLDMLKIDSWDLTGTGGPEAFKVYVNDALLFTFLPETGVVATAFGLDGVVGSGAVSGTTGVSWVVTSKGSDSQMAGVSTYTDRAYHLQLIVNNPGTSVKVGLGAILDETTDESLGIDNVQVVSRNSAAPLTSAVIASALETFETTPTTWSVNTTFAYLAGYAGVPFTLDTVAPALTINPIAGDDVINFAERTSVISGTFGGLSPSLLIAGVSRPVSTTGTTWSRALQAIDITNLGQGANKVITITSADSAGNISTATRTVTVDTVAPSAVVTDNVPGVASLATGSIVYTYTFSEAVTGLSASNFTVNNGTLTAVTGGGTLWNVVVVPFQGIASGNISVTLVGGGAVDAAGNPNVLLTSANQAIDTLAPAVVLANSTAGTVINLTTWNAAAGVTTVSAELGASISVVLTGTAGSITKPLTATGIAQAVVLSGGDLASLGEGVVSVTATATDAAGNAAQAISGGNFVLDTTPPSPLVTDNVPLVANAATGSLVYTYTFNEAVTGLTTSSFTVTNAAVSGLTGSGSVWQLTVVPSANVASGVISVSLKPGSVSDAAGNVNLVSVNELQTIDTVLPTASLVASSAGTLVNLTESTAAAGVASVSAELASSVLVTLVGTVGSVTKALTGTGTAQAVVLTSPDVAAIGEGAVTVTARATDAALNPVTSTVVGFTLDTVAPLLTIGIVAGNDIVNTAELAAGTVIAGTCEAGVVVSLLLTAGQSRNTVVSGTTWSYTLTPADAAAMGQGVKSFSATTADTAGNLSTATRTITIDTVAPTASVTDNVPGVANLATTSMVYTYTFSEPVTGLVIASFTAINGTVTAVSGSGVTWQVTVTPTVPLTSGNISLSLLAGAVLDTAGNPNVLFVSAEQAIDTVAPTVALNNGPAAIVNFAAATAAAGVVNVTAEAGSNIVVTLTGAGGASVPKALVGTGSAQAVVLTAANVASLGQGLVTVTAITTDAAGNPASASGGNFTLSTLLPTLVVTDNVPLVANRATTSVIYTYTFGEAVSALATNNFTVANGAVTTVTQQGTGGTTWLVTVVPTAGIASGNITLTLRAGSVSNAAGNANLIDVNTLQALDTLAPGVSLAATSAGPLINLVEATAAAGVVNLTAEAGASVLVTLTGTAGNVAKTVSATGVQQALPLTSADLVTLGQGALSVSAVATDAAGNPTTSSAFALTLDSVAPAVTINPVSAGAIANAPPVNVINSASLAAGQVISGTCEAGAVVTVLLAPGQSRTSVVSGTTWSYTLVAADVAAMGQGVKTINVTAADFAGNLNTAALAISIDTVAATATVTDNLAGVANLATASMVYTYTFSEAVTGLVVNSFTAINASVTAVSGSGLVWQVTVTPTVPISSGNISLRLNAFSVLDVANNPNVVFISADQAIDTVAPLVTLNNGPAPVINLLASTAAAGVVNVTAEAGASIVVTLTGAGGAAVPKTLVGTGIAQAVTLNAANVATLGQGLVTVTAIATDVAGNPTPASGGNFTLSTLLPTVVVTDNVPGVANVATGSMVYTYVFSTPVVNLAVNSFIVNNGAVTAVTGSGTTWQVTVVPAAGTASGNISLTLKADAVLDAAGNPNLINVNALQAIDTLAPAVSLATTGAGAVINLTESTAGTGVVNLTAELGASVTVTLTGTSGAVSKTLTGTGGPVAVLLTLADVTAIGQGAVTVSAVALDAAGNPTTAATLALNIDTVLPAVTINAVATNDIVNAAELAANPVISGTCEAGAIVNLLIGGQARNTVVAGTTWSYTLVVADVAALGQGAKSISVTAADAAGNIGTATRAITIDTVAPTVLVTDNLPLVANLATGSIVYTYTFSEAVTGLAVGSFTAVNGTVTAVSGSGANWLVTVTPRVPITSGNISLTLKANTVFDAAGNPNVVFVSADQVIDTVAPTVVLSNGPALVVNQAASTAAAGVVNVTAEAGANVTVTLTGAGGTSVTKALVGTGAAQAVTLNAANVTALGQGLVTVTAQALDVALNATAASGGNFTLSTVLPSVIVTDNVPLVANIATGSMLYTYEFSASVIGLTVDSFTITNGAVTSVTGSGTSWQVAVTPAAGTASGNITLSLKAGSVSDAAGNLNLINVNALQAIDTLAPAVSLATTSAGPVINFVESTASAGAVNVTVEAGVNVVVTLTGTAGSVTKSLVGTGLAQAVTLSALDVASIGQGAVSATALATDAAGNASSAAALALSIDTVLPAITINNITADNIVNAAELAANTVISGSCEAGAVVNLLLGGQVRSTVVTGTAWSYTLTTADVAVLGQGAGKTINVTAADAAGNIGTTQRTIAIDTVAPTASVTDNVPLVANRATSSMVYTYTFSEVVTGLVINSFTAVNGVVTAVTGSGTTWSVTVTPLVPITGGNISLSLKANAVLDTAGNPNVLFVSADQVIDTVAPTVVLSNGPASLVNFAAATAAAGVVNVTAEAGSNVSVTLAGTLNSVTKTLVGTAQAQAITLSAADVAALGQGAVTVTAQTLDAALNATSASGGNFTLATLLPSVVVSDNVPLVANIATGSMVYTYAFSTVVIGLNSDSFTVANGTVTDVSNTGNGSTWLVTVAPNANVASGAISLTLNAGSVTDAAGNANLININALQAIDTVAPGVSLAYSSAGPVINLTESSASAGLITLTAELNVGVVVTLAGTAGSVTKTLTGTGAPQAVQLTSADITTLGQGAVSATALATDAAGNPTPAGPFNISIDTVLPALTINNVTPDNIVNAAELAAGTVISGTNEAGAVVNLLLIAGQSRNAIVTGTTWSYTLVPVDIAAMGQGAQFISVTAADAAGNIATALRTILIDTVLPTVASVVDNVPGAANLATTSMVYTYTFNEAVTGLAIGSFTAINGAVTGVTGSGAVWQVTVAPTVPITSGNISLTLKANSVTDVAGNQNVLSVSAAQAIDTVAPTITLNNGPSSIVNFVASTAAAGVVNVTAEAGSSVNVTLTGTAGNIIKPLVGTASVQAVTLTAVDVATLGQGLVTVTAVALDAAGNPTPASGGNFTLSTVLPVAVVTDNVPLVANLATGSVLYTYVFNAPVLGLNVNSFTTSNGAVTAVTGSGTTWQVTVVPTAGVTGGNISLTLKAGSVTDAAQNTNLVNVNALQAIDTAAPAVSLAVSSAGAVINLAESTAGAGVVNLTAEAGTSVIVTLTGSAGSVAKTLTGTGLPQAVTLTAANVTSIGQGALNVTAIATDAAGNPTSATALGLSIDTLAPAVTINVVAGDNIINASETSSLITGTCEAGAVVNLTIAGLIRSTVVSGTTWSYTLVSADMTALGQGAQTLSVTALDAAGNVGTASRAITIDTLAPAVSINIVAGDDIINASEQTAPISGTCEAGAVVNLLIGGVIRGATVTGTTWSYTLSPDDISALGQGASLVTANASDAAGNVGTSTRSVLVDTVAPSFTMSNSSAGPVVNLAEAASGALSFTAEAGASVSVVLTGTAGSVTKSIGGTGSVQLLALTTADAVALGQGAVSVSASATDLAGNATLLATGANFTLDTQVPVTASSTINVNGTYALRMNDFGAAAAGKDVSAVQMDSAPGLFYKSGAALTNGVVVSVADIIAGNIVWQPSANVTSSQALSYHLIDTAGNLSATGSALTLLRNVNAAATLDASSGSKFEKIAFSGNWTDAFADAVSRGGHLATLDTASQYSAAQTLWGATPALASHVGLEQSSDGAEPSSAWHWVTGQAQVVAVSPWAAGQPVATPDTAALASSSGLTALDGVLPSYLIEFENAAFVYTGLAAQADLLTGTALNDVIAGMGGADTVNAGAGDDRIMAPDLTFVAINGGAGFDVLELTGAMTINLSSLVGKVSNIEAIALGSGTQALTLSFAAVTAMSTTTDTLFVSKDVADTVTFSEGIGIAASQWHAVNGANGMTVYQYFDMANQATQAKVMV